MGTEANAEIYDVSSINCAFEEMGRNERHFNTLQSEYRKLASGWLIAALGAMGYVLLSRPQGELTVSLMFAIGLGSSVGVCVLWILDYVVYQRLLEACFNAAEEFERKFPSVGSAHTSVKKSMPSNLVSISILIYYLTVASAAPVGAVVLQSSFLGKGQVVGLLALPAKQGSECAFSEIRLCSKFDSAPIF